MMMALYSIGMISGFLSAKGFWLGRTMIQDGWSSKRIFKVCMNLVYSFATNLILTLGLGFYFFYEGEYWWGAAAILYFASPFIIGRSARRFDDRVWAIPLTSVVLLANTIAYGSLLLSLRPV